MRNTKRTAPKRAASPSLRDSNSNTNADVFTGVKAFIYKMLVKTTVQCSSNQNNNNNSLFSFFNAFWWEQYALENCAKVLQEVESSENTEPPSTNVKSKSISPKPKNTNNNNNKCLGASAGSNGSRLSDELFPSNDNNNHNTSKKRRNRSSRSRSNNNNMSSLLCANTSFAHAVSGVSFIIIPHTITALREFSFPNSNLPPGAYMEQMAVLYLHLLKQHNFNHKKTNANNNNNSNMVQYCQSLKIKDGCNHTNAFFPISSIEVTDDTLPTADVLLFLLLLIEQETRFLFFSHNNNNNSILSPLKQKYLFGLIWNVLRFLAKNKNDSRTVQLESLTAIECNLLCTFVVETIVQKMSNNNNKSTADSNDNNKTVWTEVEMLLNSILFEKKETETESDRPDENTVKFLTINLVQFYSVITFTSLSLLTLKHIVQPTLLINLSRKSGIDQNVEKFTYSFLNSTVASVLKGLEDDDRHSEEAKNSPANEDEQKEEPTAQEEPTVHVDPNDGVSEEKENSSEAEVPPPQAFHYAPSPSDENRGKEEQAEATSEVKEDEHRDEEEAELPDAEATSDNNEKLDNEKEEEPADVEAATNENENEEPLETANESAIPPITGTFAIPARRLSSLLLQHLLISWVATAPDEEEQAEEEDTDKTGAVRARLQQAQKEYEDCFTRENETNDRDNDKSALWGRFGFLLLELFQMIL